MNNFMTIKEASKAGLAAETYLRRLVKEQKCPGVYSGTRFYINVPMLEEQLNRESIPKNTCETEPDCIV
ncbi:MAG: hypothetical protein LUD72_07520 [Bacteroidales bacterium]|nr:hypothetical protein [Bacteroidales bacterium]